MHLCLVPAGDKQAVLPSGKEDGEMAEHKPRPGSKAMRRERIKQKREAKRLERQAGSDDEDVAGGAQASHGCLMGAIVILTTWQVQQSCLPVAEWCPI